MRVPAFDDHAALRTWRDATLYRKLMRAGRAEATQTLAGIHERGYRDVTLTDTNLLANLDTAGCTVVQRVQLAWVTIGLPLRNRPVGAAVPGVSGGRNRCWVSRRSGTAVMLKGSKQVQATTCGIVGMVKLIDGRGGVSTDGGSDHVAAEAAEWDSWCAHPTSPARKGHDAVDDEDPPAQR